MIDAAVQRTIASLIERIAAAKETIRALRGEISGLRRDRDIDMALSGVGRSRGAVARLFEKIVGMQRRT